MRSAALALLAAVLVVFGFTRLALAATTEAGRAVEDANAALNTDPPNRDAAVASLKRAISASDDPEAVGQAHFVLGKLEEDQGAYEAALADDRAAIAVAPNTRWALRASERTDWLLARSEGNFEPLRRLENIRRDPTKAENAATMDALAGEAEAFPPGVVRVEARMFMAEAYLGRFHRPGDAIAELRKVTADPKAEPLTRRLAERQLVDALAGEGRIDEAVAEARAHAMSLDPGFATHIERLGRRRTVRLVAYAVLLTFAVLVVAALVRAQRRGALGSARSAIWKLAPLSACFVAFVALTGGALASNYERGNAAPFLWLGCAVLPLVLLARAWSAVGSPSTSALLVRVALSGASVVAAAFALLDGLTPAYLEGFGL
jgi:hypothetical protein